MSYDPFIVGYFYTRVRMNMRPEVANKMKRKFLLCDLKLELQEGSSDLYHLFDSPLQQLNTFYNFLENLSEDIPIHNEEFFEGVIANSILYQDHHYLESLPENKTNQIYQLGISLGYKMKRTNNHLKIYPKNSESCICKII